MAMEAGIVRKAMIYLGIVDENSPELDVIDDQPEPVCVDDRHDGVRVVRRPKGPSAVAAAAEAAAAAAGPAIASAPAVGRRADVALPPRPRPSARVHVVTPVSFADAQEIADCCREDQPVIVNLQGADGELTRRLIDFCSGVAYGLDGSMEKIAHQVLLLTPADIEVSADERDRWVARPVRA
jgi:cell division inhibitor SepF